MRASGFTALVSLFTIVACAQLQGLDGYEKVECLDDCVDTGAPPIGEDVSQPPIDSSTGVDTGTADVDAGPPPCENGVKDSTEADIDCGGSCSKKCALGKGCLKVEDCDVPEGGTLLCLANTCSLPICVNNVKDPTESDVDCGGNTCPKCANGKTCTTDNDCASGACDGTCVAKPVLTSLSPPFGGTAGGTTITLSGTSFVDKAGWTASVGAMNAPRTFLSSTTVQAVTPAGAAGKVDVSILGMPGGTLSLTQAFTYVNLDILFGAAVDFVYSNSNALGVGDFSGDGKPDLVQDHGGTHFDAQINSSVAAGAQTFTGTTCIGGSCAGGVSFPSRIVVADIDGDGKADLLHTEPATNLLALHISIGTGFNTATTFATGTSPQGMVAADFNGDNRLDVAVINGGADAVSIFLNNGMGGFGAATAVSVPRGTRIAVADLNGDGKRDLVTSSSQNNQVNVLLGKGDGTFNTATAVALGAPSKGIAIGDVDGDGKLDIVAGSGGKLSTLRGNGNGTFAAAVDSTVPNATSIPNLVVADLNGDGRADVVFVDVANGVINIWASAVGGAFMATGKTFAVTGFTDTSGDVALVDLNADNKLDLVYVGTSISVRTHLRQ